MAKGSSEKPITVYAAIVANAIIAIAKFGAAFLTGSSAMISEGIHSVVDTGNEFLLLLGVNRSKKEPDHEHPFGYGQEIYFWGLIVAMVLFGAGGGMSVYEGITHLLNPAPLEDPLWNYIVLGVAFVAEGTSWLISFRELMRRAEGEPALEALRSSKDPAVYTVVAEDSAALAGLIIAFGGVFIGHRFQNHLADGIASILIGIVLIAVASFLAHESRGLLVGESAGPETVNRIQAIIDTEPAVLLSGPPLTMHLGPQQLIVNVHVQFQPDLSLEELQQASIRLETRIQEQVPKAKHVFLEVKSFEPESSWPDIGEPQAPTIWRDQTGEGA